jgi:hypothetical protein
LAQLVPVDQRNPEQVKVAIQRMEELAAGQTLNGNWKEFPDADRIW